MALIRRKPVRVKILLLADIHSNWPALQAIEESFDVCLFLGDAVDYAADPVPVIEWLQKNATHSVRGNHDHSVAQRVTLTPGGMFRRIAAGLRPHHFDVLKDTHLTWLAQLPVTQHLTIGEHSFLLVHASPRDPMDEYVDSTVEAWQSRLQHVDVDFVCVGHTHVPMNLDLGDTKVINPGSVGQPRDGDCRASYAVIENGEVTFHRIDYDIEATVEHMRQSGIDQQTVLQTKTVLNAGGNPYRKGT